MKGKEPTIEKQYSMYLYVANISNVVETGKITWQEPRYCNGCPSDRMLYTLLMGRSELIMMGGATAYLKCSQFELATVQMLAFAKAPRFLL